MSSYTPLYYFLARSYLKPPDEAYLEVAADIAELRPHLKGELEQQFSWLFDFNVYPYASVFLDPSGMLNAPWSGFVAGVYQALGLELSEGAGLAAADHVGAQLESLAVLTGREADGGLEAQRSLHAQRSLLFEHVLPWLPSFVAAIERADRGFYRALARLSLGTVLEHAEALSAGVEAPAFSFAEAEEPVPTPSVSKKGAGEARQKLQSLVTPARSGLFLSRADIQRLGRELDLPTRFAERAFMLEALLSSAADSDKLGDLFGRLHAEAAAQGEVYRVLQSEHPALAPIWSAWRVKLESSQEDLESLKLESEVLPGPEG